MFILGGQGQCGICSLLQCFRGLPRQGWLVKCHLGWRARRFAHHHGLAEIGAQQFPGRGPAITLDQAPQGQDGLTATWGPSWADETRVKDSLLMVSVFVPIRPRRQTLLGAWTEPIVQTFPCTKLSLNF